MIICHLCGRECDGMAVDFYWCPATNGNVCGNCEEEPNHDALHAIVEGRDQFNHNGQCGACGAENVPITYRPGLDLFVCLPCHAQPNPGSILVEALRNKYG